MSIKVAQNDFTRKIKDFETFTNLHKNVDLGNKLWPKALKSCPKSKKLPNLVTLLVINLLRTY